MLPRAILNKSKLWPSGSTVRVTFYEFTSLDTLSVALNAYIAKTITEKIAPYVNLNFVFDVLFEKEAFRLAHSATPQQLRSSRHSRSFSPRII